jgi:hypothetical protein
MSVEEVMAVLREDLPFYEESGGGATFTGGEPLAQPEFLLELLRACRAEGIRSALDTSGWAARELVLEAGALADLVLFDLKLTRTTRGTGPRRACRAAPYWTTWPPLPRPGRDSPPRAADPRNKRRGGDLEEAARSPPPRARDKSAYTALPRLGEGQVRPARAAYAMGDACRPGRSRRPARRRCFREGRLGATIGG